jgi:hypothetical protein
VASGERILIDDKSETSQKDRKEQHGVKEQEGHLMYVLDTRTGVRDRDGELKRRLLPARSYHKLDACGR